MYGAFGATKPPFVVGGLAYVVGKFSITGTLVIIGVCVCGVDSTILGVTLKGSYFPAGSTNLSAAKLGSNVAASSNLAPATSIGLFAGFESMPSDGIFPKPLVKPEVKFCNPLPAKEPILSPIKREFFITKYAPKPIAAIGNNEVSVEPKLEPILPISETMLYDKRQVI